MAGITDQEPTPEAVRDASQPPDSRRRLLIAGVPLALATPITLLGGCASAPPTGVQARSFAPPTVRVGDRWTYREINQYNRLPLGNADVTVSGTGPIACRIQRARSDTAFGEIPRREVAIEERYTSAWSVVHEPTYDLTMDFAEPMPLLPATLRVGESLKSRTTFTVRGYSGRYDWEQRLRTVGVERIATPAGAFETLRVRREIWFDYPDPFRRGSHRVDELWYAPEVNRWVRREWTGDYQHDTFMDRPSSRMREDWVRWELVSYSPAKA